MKTIAIHASKTYDIHIDRGLLGHTGQTVSAVLKPCKLCIITDSTVAKLYGSQVSKSLSEAGFDIHQFVFEPGEGSKTLATIEAILEYLAEKEFTRSDALAALGGGIPGDVAGFAAASFLRGIPFIQIPTTFLAAVDSSVGGKTGVNLKAGKNLAGAFWQPSLVLCDCQAFSTLSHDTFLDGVAEAIKYGVIFDRSLFDLLAANSSNLFTAAHTDDPHSILADIVAQCVSSKRDIVMADERDTGVRQLLNFGHTIGHAIETCSSYKITHGHAVAIGMKIVSKASSVLGFCSSDCAQQLEKLLIAFGFSLDCPFSAEDLTHIALRDKKRTGDTITLVVPETIGHCNLMPLPVNQLVDFIQAGL
ncbi:3-dehydroquinate synthase [Aminipila butyrica]|uniref:3-dehydroquinate synthase n=1 Tax=Aminipila butyrica TaxID=433296 RepID=A0A858BS64_9FIRM|nr:3-dehydroquinate synthase [Aminipila butyrica]QIB68049.1 3-dehydroquinate synthase [Aminipila butyrica]